MLSLPRGAESNADVPLATAAWATREAVERLAYHGGASLFVGAIPAASNWPTLRRIYDLGGAALQKTLGLDVPPARRAALVDQLEQLWRAALLADSIPLGIDDDRHFLTIAGSRSGKGTSAIIPNLCLYPGSVVCLDPKGENATLTAAARGQRLGQEVYVLDPFGVAKIPEALRASFNPLAWLSAGDPSIIEDAAMIAERLVVPGAAEDSHWDETARDFIKGLILHLITGQAAPSLLTLPTFLTQGDRPAWEEACERAEERGEARHRAETAPDDISREGLDAAREDALRAFLKANPTPFDYLLTVMRRNKALGGVIAGTAETLLACGDRERGSILSTTRRNTAFLDSLRPEFIATLDGEGRSFRPDIFKTAPKGATAYLCLPAQRMATHGRWLRLMIGVFLEWAYRELAPPACGAPVLYLLEEFYALGHMAVIEKAAGYAAGFGVKLWAILQDIPQLKAMYPRSWQTFLFNAGAVLMFGVADSDTTHYASDALGVVEVVRHVTNVSVKEPITNHGQQVR